MQSEILLALQKDYLVNKNEDNLKKVTCCFSTGEQKKRSFVFKTLCLLYNLSPASVKQVSLNIF